MVQKFKTGDKVILNTGKSPIMVVRGYDPKDSEEVTCEWFDKDQNVCDRSFHQDMIKTYSPPSFDVMTIENKYRY